LGSVFVGFATKDHIEHKNTLLDHRQYCLKQYDPSGLVPLGECELAFSEKYQK